ncbi:MAG: DNA/RNA helicase, superfamily I [Candidatus Roizmanbacteria bacterium GW2011_GWA2_37_7]|uniref:DNA/RNA helicase, superfamily I n=1 Tax=Candidatus Roizmanbacteria bacterium GW2011_GWA2_37_7 TaxID=1618481 RepID=A0A0G0KEA4_9BACT|nr:MAG: DNA/RNA helicase, superfamily I [Candidatus Roizmanbacteria bacterium GW2011_GWA2_37_7]
MQRHIVDLHIHSHYSRATSKHSNIEGLYYWSKIKGIHIVGTGDFTHPSWFAEMREKLEATESGLYKLKDEIAQKIDKTLPQSVRENPVRFVLTVEISNIYSKKGKVRKLHNCIVVPSFEVASYINAQLDRIGNIKADGRPILGMDSKHLLEITLQSHNDSLFFPAHIWTPWFAMFGSKSGFDSIAEAFEDMAPEIRAVETGLSSDPFMNWRLDELQNVTIVSNSDAHSPQKLGREANIISSPLNYKDIIGAIKTNDERMVGTIEFFPQEGKYHYDGHRLCGFSCASEETKKLNGICPKCHKPLTVGVEYRVGEIADHPENYKPTKHKQVEYVIPLPEMISEMMKVGVQSKKVQTEYEKVYTALGDEFSILRSLSLGKIRTAGFVELADVIERMRKGDIYIEPGYDGVFGKIKLFKSDIERKKLGNQMSLL